MGIPSSMTCRRVGASSQSRRRRSVLPAVYRSVRRWRLRRLVRKLPSAVAGLDGEGELVNVMKVVAPLVKGARAAVEAAPMWNRSCAADLSSAIAGGQWSQARRAAVRSWAADSRCQLCLEALGTLEHRHVCAATRPIGGWTHASAAVQSTAAAMVPERLSLVRTRGIAVERMPLPAWPQEAELRWIVGPPDVTRSDLVWYIDGSVVDATWESFASAAAAVVVVNSDGDLIAVAEAALPATVQTSGAAEACALWLVCAICPFVPRVITDCKGLLDVASGGRVRASLPSRRRGRRSASSVPRSR